MKRAVKDLKTGLYLKSMDEWTARVEDACFFRDVFQALKFCDAHHLADVAVISISRDHAERQIAFRRAVSKNSKPAVMDQAEIAPSEKVELAKNSGASSAGKNISASGSL